MLLSTFNMIMSAGLVFLRCHKSKRFYLHFLCGQGNFCSGRSFLIDFHIDRIIVEWLIREPVDNILKVVK